MVVLVVALVTTALTYHMLEEPLCPVKVTPGEAIMELLMVKLLVVVVKVLLVLASRMIKDKAALVVLA